MTSIHDFSARQTDGKTVPLKKYRGKVMLIVNTASACGFTPQFAGLQQLHQRYASQGFAVLGFPCDQFGHQEPGDEDEIKSFCSLRYDVSFPMFSKIDVNGDDAHPLYEHLRGEKPGLLGGKIKWNFTKFLVDREGRVVKRYAPTTKPGKLTGDIEKLL